MKKLLFILVVLPLGLFAKPSGELKNQNIQQEATEIARKLVGPLQLNELEYIKVKELMAQRIMALNDIADYYQYDAELMKRKTEAAKIAYERRLRYILNSQQLESYLTLQIEL